MAPHLLSLAKEVKLRFYTIPTRNRTLGRRMAVHCSTPAPQGAAKGKYLSKNIYDTPMHTDVGNEFGIFLHLPVL